MSARDAAPLGLVRDMPIDEYHASAPISNSGLNDFAQSPQHYHARHLNPLRPPPLEKAGQLEGTLAHCAILEPSAFLARHKVGPCEDRRLAEWKSWERDLRAAVGFGVDTIKPSQRAVAFAQAVSVRSNPDVDRLLAAGEAEVSAFWIDPATGEPCRCRPDWVHPLGGNRCILADVKTCGSAEPREFALQVTRKGYARQAAFYSDGFARASGLEVAAFIFIAVETVWPYAAAAYMLPDEWLEAAGREVTGLLARFASCRATDTWPGYGDSVHLLDMPRWVMNDA